jgi:DNA-binding transcriptional regulator GbsR (MarR family)
MSIRTDILAIPELLDGKRLTGTEIAAILGRPKRDVSSTIGNMVRNAALESQKYPGTKTRTYSIPMARQTLAPTLAERLNSFWYIPRIPDEVRCDAHY